MMQQILTHDTKPVYILALPGRRKVFVIPKGYIFNALPNIESPTMVTTHGQGLIPLSDLRLATKDDEPWFLQFHKDFFYECKIIQHPGTIRMEFQQGG